MPSAGSALSPAGQDRLPIEQRYADDDAADLADEPRHTDHHRVERLHGGRSARCACRERDCDNGGMRDGVHGMDQRSGFTCPNLLEADTDRALIEAGRRLVVVADHSKWGVIGIGSIARLDQADVLITDSGIEPAARATLETAVRDLVVVDVPRPAPALEVARAP